MNLGGKKCFFLEGIKTVIVSIRRQKVRQSLKSPAFIIPYKLAKVVNLH